MISGFYKAHSKTLLWIAALSLPFLSRMADSLPTNNDVETWLPNQSDVRVTYDAFKDEFGAEEVILIGVSSTASDDRLLEALAQRIEGHSGIRRCLTPQRLQAVMGEMGIPEEVARERLKGFLVAENDSLVGLVALLSDEGLKDRAGTAAAIRGQLEYCQLRDGEVSLAGAPIVVSELDRLGNRSRNKRFFLITLLISFCLLYFTLKQWKPALAILGLTVWAINLTMSIIKLAGGEMNFILGALSVMVMIFTLSISIHVLHYYRSAMHIKDPLGEALRLAWKPCFLATLTTTIGLVSLAVSDILPVRQFGYAAATGAVVALLTGLGLTPAVLTLWPLRTSELQKQGGLFTLASEWLIDHSRSIALLATLLVVSTSVGLFYIQSKIDPLDFLPHDSKILADIKRIERDLTNTSSVEAVVDFGDSDRPFIEKLDEVRKLEALMNTHPAVRHTMSVATFFPAEMPESAYEAAGLLSTARSRQSDNDFLSNGDRRWRISARVSPNDEGMTRSRIYNELTDLVAEAPINVTLTGISPLLDGAQREIFKGFWESFATAFGIITFVMIVSLRSLKLGMVAMIPNLTPIAIVFGTLGWISYQVDIGMMMTGSIALGIAVDGTFHFLVRYNEYHRRGGNSTRASQIALIQTGRPIFQAAAIAGVGMLAMTLSNFTPMARFGVMMATLLTAALVGDLVLLPALLALRPKDLDDEDDHSDSPDENAIHRDVPAPYSLRLRTDGLDAHVAERPYTPGWSDMDQSLRRAT